MRVGASIITVLISISYHRLPVLADLRVQLRVWLEQSLFERERADLLQRVLALHLRVQLRDRGVAKSR